MRTALRSEALPAVHRRAMPRRLEACSWSWTCGRAPGFPIEKLLLPEVTACRHRSQRMVDEASRALLMVEREPDLLGAHVSTSGGVHTAPARAAAIGSRWTQVFTKPPQQWIEPTFGSAEHEAYRAACKEHEVVGTTVHASYLINAASPSSELYEKSVRSLRAEYERCVVIGARHLVVHPGSATDGDREAGLARNAEAVVRVLREAAGETLLCLENTTGKGNVLGNTLEELATLLGLIRESDGEIATRVGVCLDTCHLFAAGYDLRESYEEVMTEVDRVVGVSQVKVWHLNDSGGTLGSKTDRHAGIGEGHLGTEPFRRLLCDRRFRGVPMLLETPKGDDPVASDRQNLELLRSLRDAEGSVAQ